jgi:hypothetical protein
MHLPSNLHISSENTQFLEIPSNFLGNSTIMYMSLA